MSVRALTYLRRVGSHRVTLALLALTAAIVVGGLAEVLRIQTSAATSTVAWVFISSASRPASG